MGSCHPCRRPNCVWGFCFNLVLSHLLPVFGEYTSGRKFSLSLPFKENENKQTVEPYFPTPQYLILLYSPRPLTKVLPEGISITLRPKSKVLGRQTGRWTSADHPGTPEVRTRWTSIHSQHARDLSFQDTTQVSSGHAISGMTEH